MDQTTQLVAIAMGVLASIVAIKAVSGWMTLLGLAALITLAVNTLIGVPEPMLKESPQEEATFSARKQRRMSAQSELMSHRPFGPDIPMNTINGIIFFPKVTDEKMESMKTFVLEKLKQFPRLRSRIRKVGKTMVYEEMENGVDDDRHWNVHEGVGDEAAILKYIDDKIVPLEFDTNHPLWQWDLFPHADGVIGVFTIHHCITDGYSVNRIFSVLFTDENDKPFELTQPRPPGKDLPMHQKVMYAASTFIPRLKAWAKIGSLTVIKDSATCFKDPYPYKFHPGRRTHFFPKVSVDKITEMRSKILEKTHTKVTITDVYFSLLAGGFSRYMKAHKDPLVHDKGLLVRAWTPFMFWREPSAFSLRNLWAFVSVQLVMGDKDPIDRLLSAKKRFDVIKRSPEATAQLDISAVVVGIGRHFKALMKWIFMSALSNQSLIFTSVPFFQKTAYLDGVPVLDLRATMPVIVPFCALLSYAGNTCASIVLDPARIDGEEFVKYVHEELQDLGKTVGMEF
jgi:hypothetical protein